MRVGVTALIVVTMFVSAVCSVVGGLWLFFKSIESLEATVKHSSEIEIEKLKDKLLLTFSEVEAANWETYDMLMSAQDSIIQSPVLTEVDNTTGFLNIPESATADWVNLMHWRSFSRLKYSKVLEDVGLMLVTYDQKDPTQQYTHVWYDPRHDGTRDYVFAYYANGMSPYNASADPWVNPRVLCYAIDAVNGTVSHYVSSYDYTGFTWAAKNDMPLDGNFSQYTADTPPGKNFVRGTGPPAGIIQRYRKPDPWYGSDRYPYVYSAFDVGYAPPPPPHPWSGFKQIWIQTYFLFNTWETAMVEYAASSKDTTVIIYDQTTDFVYVASNGAKLINDQCWLGDDAWGGTSGDKTLGDCAMRIVNMSSVIRAAWKSAAQARATRVPSIFWKARLDGSDHFLRHTQLFTFKTDHEPIVTTIDTALLWLATTDSVQKEVFAALTVFIIFAVMVFVFDISMALLEIYLVGHPLTKISKSLDNLYAFQPELVLETMRCFTVQSCFTITEVYEVAKGLEVACNSLIEYKAYLPSTLFAAQEDSEQEESSCVKSETNTSKQSMSRSNMDEARGVRPTGVSLASVKGSFVKVCFLGDGHTPTAETLATVTELVEHSANIVKGTVLISPCEPGTFYVSWNVARKVSEGAPKAALFFNTIKAQTTQRCVTAGMVHGTVAAGNVGSKSLRGFVIHGSILNELHGAQVYASKLQASLNTPVAVMGSKMGELLAGMFNTVAVGVLQVGNEKPDVVLCLLDAVEQETQEWMYQLGETKRDSLHMYFAEVARTGKASIPTMEGDELCDEQKAALSKARRGEAVRCYKKDALLDLDTSAAVRAGHM